MTDAEYPLISSLLAGMRCRCPRCGRGRVFACYLDVATVGAACGLDLSREDASDGPAVFVVLVVIIVLVGLALAAEIILSLPMWLHLVVWASTILGLSLWMLRPFKATLIVLQFNYNAGEVLGGGGAGQQE